MSAIFNELRLLEARRASGALSLAEFEKQKSALLDDIPEVFEIDPVMVEPQAKPVAQPAENLWDVLLLWIVGAVLCGAAAWAITGNFGTAATLGITVLAAFTIKLFTALD